MDGHAPGLLAEVVAAGRHQAQLTYVEVGAEASDAADVERPGGFHQHHGQLGGAAHTRPFK